MPSTIEDRLAGKSGAGRLQGILDLLRGGGLDANGLAELLGGSLTGAGKRVDLHRRNQSEIALEALLRENFGIADAENAAIDKSKGVVRDAFTRADEGFAGLQRQMNRNLFSAAGDQAAGVSKDATRALRRSLGARGIGNDSAAATDQLFRIRGDRTRAMDSSRRGIAHDFANRVQAENAARFSRALGLADSEARGPSTFRSDTLASLVDLRESQQGRESEMRNAKKAAKAQKRAGIMQGIGGLLGAGFSFQRR